MTTLDVQASFIQYLIVAKALMAQLDQLYQAHGDRLPPLASVDRSSSVVLALPTHAVFQLHDQGFDRELVTQGGDLLFDLEIFPGQYQIWDFVQGLWIYPNAVAFAWDEVLFVQV